MQLHYRYAFTYNYCLVVVSSMVLKAIKKRRSIRKFELTPVEDDKIASILEAGRWAPSFSNLQPWEFIVVQDADLKHQLYEAAKEEARRFAEAIEQAPAVIVTIVDPNVDTRHFVEDGAIATQNMALAAYSLGLGSCWIGVYNTAGEEAIKGILDVPQKCRVISLLPIGTPTEIPVALRKKLEEITHYEKYGRKSR